MEIEAVDRRILAALGRDSRISNADLAEHVGLSASSCWRRVRALENAGVIKRYGIAIDEEKLGQTFHAIVHVHLTRHDRAQLMDFVQAVEANDVVRACYATTGQSDYHLIVRCRDLDAYNQFLEGFLFRQPAVASAQTNLVLKTLKSRDTGL